MDRGCDIVDWKKINAVEFYHRATEVHKDCTEKFASVKLCVLCALW